MECGNDVERYANMDITLLMTSIYISQLLGCEPLS